MDFALALAPADLDVGVCMKSPQGTQQIGEDNHV